MENLQGKVVLITGASSGIGAATAVEFSKYGCRLALTGRDKENLANTAHNCVQTGLDKANIYTITGDLTVQDDVTNIVSKSVQHFGRLDILINNAGMTFTSTFENCTMEILDANFNINVKSAFMVTKAALQNIKDSHGSIVNVSSLAGEVPLSYNVPYGMAKVALTHMTKCLALELAPYQVRVNCVAPSVTDTPIFRRGNVNLDSETIQKNFAKYHPLGRVADAIEVARAIVFLASDAASFTTGLSFPIDGGRGITTVSPVGLN